MINALSAAERNLVYDIGGEKSVKLTTEKINLGIYSGGGGTQRLTCPFGEGKAMETILTVMLIDAQTALNWLQSIAAFSYGRIRNEGY